MNHIFVLIYYCFGTIGYILIQQMTLIKLSFIPKEKGNIQHFSIDDLSTFHFSY